MAGRGVDVVATERSDGDFHLRRVDPAVLARRQTVLTGRRWSMAHQVHGCEVIDVDADSGDGCIRTGDVMVSRRAGIDLAIWAADCAPLVLIADDGTIVAAHGGWRGLAAGVVDVAVCAATSQGSPVACAVLGPVVHPCCYEFGPDDIRSVAHGVHAGPAGITGETHEGRHALDVPAAVVSALTAHGVELDVTGPCTGCDDRFFSHRVRADAARHATVVSASTQTSRHG